MTTTSEHRSMIFLMNDKPKRRVRYKGTHPRRFEEKYKELNPEKYANDAKKIMSRGATPAGTHRPICVNEILDFLKPQPGQILVDATLGYGGHSQAILEKLSPGGTLIAFDQDPLGRPKTEARLNALNLASRLIVVPSNFRNLENELKKLKLPFVDGVLADLGLSSMQIDDPARGFSFKTKSSFDLRMNPESGTPAYELFNTLSEDELRQILVENSDEPHARQIAAALKRKKPKKTDEVAECVRGVTKTFSKNIREKEGDTPIKRVFQALRIVVNDEFAALDDFLQTLPRILKPKGRIAILSFHSGEDRRVKKSFQYFHREGIYSEIAPEALRASKEEQFSNPRSKPAKLRWAVRS